MAARRRPFLLVLTFAATVALPRADAQNTAPVIDAPVPGNRVTPTIPGGRTLLFPITASDADGDRLTYTVTSSKPHILARVKTGNPFLKFTVNHAGNGTAGDPAYAGDLVFMLLRDWTPITAGFIGGFAQSGFYDGLTFHRLASLGSGTTGFIFQGGDPLGTGGGGPGFRFDNELDPALNFVGRGLLAMANSGTQGQITRDIIGNPIGNGDFSDTNGSQFFITDGQPRHLDFRHTIFAQLVRGWELLPLMKATPTTSTVPNVPVTITSASVVPTSGANNTDAVLVLSAVGAGDARITVTVDDRRGGRVSASFTVMGAKETINAPPFLRKIAPQVTPRNTAAIFDLEAIDLEHDFLDIEHARTTVGTVNTSALSNFVLNGSTRVTRGRTAALQPNNGYEGPLFMGFEVGEFDVSAQAFTADASRLKTGATIGVGDRIAVGERVVIEGAPGVALSGVVGKIRDFDLASVAGDFTATINWGDGEALDAGTVGRDVNSAGATLLTVSGTHTYDRAGVYPVVVNFTGNKGVVGVARGQAIIAATAICAAGEALEIAGATVQNRVLATFTDTASTDTPGDYRAQIDWGDGAWSDGVVAAGAGERFVVRGTHRYRDSERYAVHVRIQRASDPPGVNEAWAWSAVTPSFRATPHLPPFPKPNLLAVFFPVGDAQLTKTFTGVPGPDYRAQIAGTFILVNSGNRAVPRANVRFWLSSDPTLSKATDTLLRFKPQGFSGFITQIPLFNFPAGGSTNNFGVTLALPRGESGGRKYVVTELDYRDALTDVEAIDKQFATPQIDPAFVLSPPTSLQTTEAGGSATFTVVLDTPPTADVTIPLASSVVAEGTVSPSQLVFTAANWNTPQTVTVTGVDDTADDGNKAFVVQLNAVTSTDTLYSGLNPPDVTFTNLDNDP
jgi:cyclophilin family peptidyl-prolyl cis-trans isomerase